MSTTTYNPRTLAACAKRLRWIQERGGNDLWAVVWRHEEGFRLQIHGEQHEHTGWIAYGPLVSSKLEDIERDLKLGRADEIAEESLELCLDEQPEDFTDEQLRTLSCWSKHDRIAGKAFLTVHARWHERHLGRNIA
jgi:hypothetical protein